MPTPEHDLVKLSGLLSIPKDTESLISVQTAIEDFCRKQGWESVLQFGESIGTSTPVSIEASPDRDLQEAEGIFKLTDGHVIRIISVPYGACGYVRRFASGVQPEPFLDRLPSAEFNTLFQVTNHWLMLIAQLHDRQRARESAGTGNA